MISREIRPDHGKPYLPESSPIHFSFKTIKNYLFVILAVFTAATDDRFKDFQKTI